MTPDNGPLHVALFGVTPPDGWNPHAVSQDDLSVLSHVRDTWNVYRLPKFQKALYGMWCDRLTQKFGLAFPYSFGSEALERPPTMYQVGDYATAAMFVLGNN